MRKYRLVAKKGEGTFSEVLKAQNIKDNKYHAIKCMKNHFESIDQVNNLREIQALRRLSPHPHIVKLEEVLYDQPSGRLALVFELMDANLYEIIRGRRHYLKPELIRSFMYQLMKAMDHMHNKGIFHRDIKPENILVDNSTDLKLADFGSCRGIYSKQPYTEYISTRWYRAPECLLTDGYYGSEMDMWGIGCVFFEITSLYPLFPGSNELDQIHRIHKILGTPSADVLEVFKRKGAAHLDFNFAKEDGTSIAKLIPHAPPEAVDLMCKMLSYEPGRRITARQALQHVYFRDLREKDAQVVSHASLSNQTTVAEKIHRHKKNPHAAPHGPTDQQQHHNTSHPLPNIKSEGSKYVSKVKAHRTKVSNLSHQTHHSHVSVSTAFSIDLSFTTLLEQRAPSDWCDINQIDNTQEKGPQIQLRDLRHHQSPPWISIDVQLRWIWGLRIETFGDYRQKLWKKENNQFI